MFSSRSASRFRGPLERLGKVIVVEDVVQLKNELINAASDAERVDALEELSKEFISLEILEQTKLGRVVKRLVKDRKKLKNENEIAKSEENESKEDRVLQLGQSLLDKWMTTVEAAMERRRRVNKKFGSKGKKRSIPKNSSSVVRKIKKVRKQPTTSIQLKGGNNHMVKKKGDGKFDMLSAIKRKPKPLRLRYF
eukprot:g263.t1